MERGTMTMYKGRGNKRKMQKAILAIKGGLKS